MASDSASDSLNCAVSGAPGGRGEGWKIKDALLARETVEQIDDFAGSVGRNLVDGIGFPRRLHWASHKLFGDTQKVINFIRVVEQCRRHTNLAISHGYVGFCGVKRGAKRFRRLRYIKGYNR